MNARIVQFLAIQRTRIALYLQGMPLVLIASQWRTNASAGFTRAHAAGSYSKCSPGADRLPCSMASGVTLTGGVVLDGWGPLYEKVYATSNFAHLSDSKTTLTGALTGKFDTPGLYSGIKLTVVDGHEGAEYKLTACDKNGAVVDSSTEQIAAGGTTTIHVHGRQISHFVLTGPDNVRHNYAVTHAKFTRFRYLGCQSTVPSRKPAAIKGTAPESMHFKRET
jgi:hypothetical protein